ncbi:MAG TPA: NfeD family protein [Rudaea sp.]|jgi:membrane protein implicated in regulation of membrane protease activity|nr:NfeD family protein [Rudaea sp.]
MLENLTLHYGWWLLALVLIGAELMAPGFFMLWIGMAAAALGVVLIFVPQMSFGMQAVVFAVFAVISCYVYWRFVRHAMSEVSDQPRLNRRAEQYIGRRFVLETAIVNGQGKARVGDSLWLAEGPDLPAGSPVEVVGVDGSTLKVKAA